MVVAIVYTKHTHPIYKIAEVSKLKTNNQGVKQMKQRTLSDKEIDEMELQKETDSYNEWKPMWLASPTKPRKVRLFSERV
jgi:hypothetical protein